LLLKDLSQILGKYLAYFSLCLILPLLLALYDQSPTAHAFVYSILVSLVLALILRFLGRGAMGQIDRRGSILLVALIWISSAILGALPFYFSGTLQNPMDAYFESMSGLTTTGSTMMSPKMYDKETGNEIPVYITYPETPMQTYAYYGTIAPIRDSKTGLILYSGVEAVDRSILFFRSFLQWVGGMGIVVLFLTVLPALGVGGKFLYQVEVTGPFKDALSPRIHDTASHLWKLYLSLTLLEVVLLISFDSAMPLFDAVCTSLSTISTGGFSIKNDSIASYHNGPIQWIIILFMILGSINFSLYFHIIRMKIYRIYVPDFLIFLGIILFGSLFVSLFLVGDDLSLGEAFRQGIFQAVSCQTSTGFVTANYDLWALPAQALLLLLMFVGGMSGSTAGGIKTSRFYILYKIVMHRLESLYRPDTIRKLRIGSYDVDDKQALTVLGFFCIVLIFTVLGTFLFILDRIDPETSLGLVACFMNNVGCAFRAAGPTETLGFLSNFDKFLATSLMLFGRLEFYVLLLLFLPSYWKGR
jgi:trk system potassium uptake protein TrkH